MFCPRTEISHRLISNSFIFFQSNLQILENKTKLIDLNFDYLLLVFEQMDIPDLISISQATKIFLYLANEVIKQKFTKFELKIFTEEDYWRSPSFSSSSFATLVNDYIPETVLTLFGSGQNVDSNKKSTKIAEEVKIPVGIFLNHIETYDLNYTLMILRRFGDVIRDLSIENHRMGGERSDKIISQVNKFCSESLSKLNLGFIKPNTMKLLTQPFKNVVELSFEVSLGKISLKILPLNKLFPKLKRLLVSLYTNLNYNFIDCHMPNLEHLKAEATYEMGSELRSDLIESVIRKNPQIRSIELSRFRPGFIQTVNRLLPQLENLTTSGYDIGNELIHFENVKNAKFDMIDGLATQITFAKLENLQIKYLNHEFDDWRTFFSRHRNLRRLHIYENQQGNYLSHQIEQLTTDLNNLTKVSLESADFISDDAIVRFIQNHEKLQILKVTMRYFKDSIRYNLIEKLQNEWEIRDFKDFWAGFELKRKISTQNDEI